MRRMRVYVAGPMTINGGDDTSAGNIRRGIDAANKLLDSDFAPYVPQFSHFWQMFYPHSVETWMDLDFTWLRQCDAVLRLAGESAGADKETALAEQLGIPVFYNILGLVDWRDWTVWRNSEVSRL